MYTEKQHVVYRLVYNIGKVREPNKALIASSPTNNLVLERILTKIIRVLRSYSV
jgi:hypothetical protein